jgi:beta-glucosidase
MSDTVKRDEVITFPKEFRFGVADADLQVLGEDQARANEGSEPSMWYAFADKTGLETPGIGSDRYNRWREDIDHMREMGVKHYRTSISMARTLHRNGEVNLQAIEWYKSYFKALRDAGISIYATLYHWELPQHLQEMGGWINREAVTTAFLRHTQAVVEHLGQWIEEYFILNEPWCSSFLSYYLGIHAPGKQHESHKENLREAVVAAHHLLLAQGLAFRRIKELAPQAKVSTVFNVQPAYLPSPSPENSLAAQYGDGYFNGWFFDPLFLGHYPEQIVELYGEDSMPPGYQDDMEVIKVGDKLHSMGINYYRGALYISSRGAVPIKEVKYEGGLTNHLDWPIFEPPLYPEGLYDILQQIYYSYRAHGLKRMYITENGIALDTSWDDRRIEYLAKHLSQLHKALLRGIPLEAYFTWTLLDNYEWAEGYSARSSFGLIHVDRPSLKRTWKQSAYWYRDLMKTHVLNYGK